MPSLFLSLDWTRPKVEKILSTPEEDATADNSLHIMSMSLGATLSIDFHQSIEEMLLI